MEMDIITFVEDVLDIRLNSWQEEYIKRMNDIYKIDRDRFVIMCRVGYPTCMSVSIALYEIFKRYETEKKDRGETGGSK